MSQGGGGSMGGPFCNFTVTLRITTPRGRRFPGCSLCLSNLHLMTNSRETCRKPIILSQNIIIYKCLPFANNTLPDLTPGYCGPIIVNYTSNGSLLLKIFALLFNDSLINSFVWFIFTSNFLLFVAEFIGHSIISY